MKPEYTIPHISGPLQYDTDGWPIIDWSGCPVVESVPGRVSGAPVIVGSRLPVDAVIVNWDQGHDHDALMRMFDGLSAIIIDTVVEYRQAYLDAHCEPCPHCAKIIAEQGSLGINRPMFAEIEHLLATAEQVDVTGLTEEEALAFLEGKPRLVSMTGLSREERIAVLTGRAPGKPFTPD